MVYADYAASGRALDFIERCIQGEVLPFYANTHTEVSANGRRMTDLREDARGLIHQSVGGGEDDVVLFCGTGSTGAVNKLVDVLGLRIPASLEDRYGLSDGWRSGRPSSARAGGRWPPRRSRMRAGASPIWARCCGRPPQPRSSSGRRRGAARAS
jgi:hypothetical protein